MHNHAEINPHLRESTKIADIQQTKDRQTQLLGCKRFHLWSPLSNPSCLKDRQSVRRESVRAVEEESRHHLEMNGATRARLAQPRRTAYLKADVTKHRQPESRAELSWTQPGCTELRGGGRLCIHSKRVINLTQLHNKGWALCVCKYEGIERNRA